MGKPLTAVKRFSDEKKWEDEIEWFSFPDDKMVLVRLVGDVEVLARHWIKTLSGKMFPAWCPRLNSEEEFDHTRPCPAHGDFEDKAQKMIICNAIIRNVQERGDPDPIKGIMLPHAVNDDLVSIAELIKGNPADTKEGVDLAIKYSSKAVGNKKWSIQRGDKTPLSEQELKYRTYQFTKIVPQFDDPEVAAQYAKNMKEAMARHKYYVVQDAQVPRNARDPFKYFRGDARGRPWTEFSELVDHRNAEKGDDAQTHRVRRDAPARQPRNDNMYQDDEAPPARRAVREAPPPPPQEDAPADDPPAAEAATEEQPECFTQYTGTAPCARCHVRAKCIELTEDEDM
jgi:hypothetical protein